MSNVLRNIRSTMPAPALLLGLLLATGCTAQLSPGSSDAVAPATAASETPARAAFDRYVQDFWSEGDAAAIERAMSPTITYHYNGMTAEVDHARHRDGLRDFRARFPDLQAVTDAYAESAGYGAAATTWTGSYSGTICGEPAAEPFSWSVNYVFRMEGDRIVELWETWDEGGLLRKLGVGPGACEA